MNTPDASMTRVSGAGAPRLLIMGPPGAGKGTQAQVLSTRLSIPAISTGDIFRANVAAHTPLGVRVEAILAAGGYVDDDLTNEIVAHRLAEQDAAAGFLLDGYPRTVLQVDALDVLLSEAGTALDGVISLAVDLDEVTRRLLLRSQQQGRADDTEIAVRRRQQIYHAETRPVLDVYTARGLVVEIDGLGDPTSVTSRILTQLNQKASVAL